jgi:SecD/SecF fusion protein
VIGTSSSILIAAPILNWLGIKRGRKGLAQVRPIGESVQGELDRLP